MMCGKFRALDDWEPIDKKCIVGESYDCYDCKFIRLENETLEFCEIKEIVRQVLMSKIELSIERKEE